MASPTEVLLSKMVTEIATLQGDMREVKLRAVHAPLNAGTTVLSTINAGIISATRPHISLIPESGTADNLDFIGNPHDGKIIALSLADAGDTITVRHHTSTVGGNISLRDEADFALDDMGLTLLFMYKETTDKWEQVGATSSGSGVETFLDLTDTPDNYTGHAGKAVAVNGTEDGLVFLNFPSAPVDSVNGQTGVVVLDSDDIAEGSVNLYLTVSEAALLASITAFGESLINDVDAAAGRATLGLGTIATQPETDYFLLAGRAGGQIGHGGTAASENLTLRSTSHATKGNVVLDDPILLSPGGIQDYLITQDPAGEAIHVRGQGAGQSVDVRFETADGDGSDSIQISIWAEGKLGSTADRSRMRFLYDATSGQFHLDSEANGAGTPRPIVIFTEGNSNQLFIATDGDVGIGTGAPANPLHVVRAVDGGETLILVENSVSTASSLDEFAGIQFMHNAGAAAKILAGKEEDFTVAANRTGFLSFHTRKDGAYAEHVRISSAGFVGIGTIAPAAALEIGAGGSLYFSDPDVAHGMTVIAPTNVWGKFYPLSGTDGGMVVDGYSDADATALFLRGIIGADPVDATAAVLLRGAKKNGTSITELDATETLLGIDNNGGRLITVLGSGFVGIGTISPGTKLEIKDGAFTLSDADVAHGMTTLHPTDAYGYLGHISATEGGLVIDGMSEGTTYGLLLRGNLGSTDPTDSLAAIEIRGAKKSGTTIGDLAALETVLNIRNNGTELVTILGSGSVGIGKTNPISIFQIQSSRPILTLSDNTGGSWSSGDNIGRITWRTEDTSAAGPREVAHILIENDYAPAGQTTMSARMAFFTAEFNGTAQERMSIAGVGGNVTIHNSLIVTGEATVNSASVGGIKYVDFTTVGNVGGGTDDLMTYTVPANMLSTNGHSLWFEAWGTTAANVNVKTLTFHFGGQNDVLFSVGLNNVEWHLYGRIIRTGAATQKILLYLTQDGLVPVLARRNYTQTLSGALTLKLTAAATTTNDITQDAFIVGWDDEQ